MKKFVVGMSLISSCLLLPSTARCDERSPQFHHIESMDQSDQQHSHRFAKLNSLLEDTGYKTYVLGVQLLTGNTDHFQESFFLSAIRNHPAFKGCGETIQLTETKDAMDKSHFYLSHRGGVRHFTVEPTQIGDRVAYRLCNAAQKHYPTLDSFIECTVG